MRFYQPLLDWLAGQPEFSNWGRTLAKQLPEKLSVKRWGDLSQWQAALDNLPDITASHSELKDHVTAYADGAIPEAVSGELCKQLMELHPWRKGPFQLFNTFIDTEWRSDWKWARVLPHLPSLAGQTILDVGCGNGYHCLRMAGAGADRVIGIEPSVKFVYQFYALKKYLGELTVDVLPLGIEQMPANLRAFDTVFSMGILYHRRSPMDHLRELRALVRPGGQIVLETLVIEGEMSEVLVPEGRYAKMPNVWFIPSPDTLISWLRKSNFSAPRLVDICRTSTGEQRSTGWMRFESLKDFLDPENPELTVEGHPGPVRAVFLADVTD